MRNLFYVAFLALGIYAVFIEDPATYNAVAHINGQEYIMDHDLTYDDCMAEQKIYPTFICTRS